MVAERGEGRYPIRAVDRVCDLLDALRTATDGVSLTTLAEEVDLPKSSALRYLSALEARHYVSRDGADGLYRVGVAFQPDRGQWYEQAQVVALPHLVALRDHFGETINLGALDGASMVHVEVAESLHAVRLAAARGQRAPLHATAIGKAAATLVSADVIRQVLARAGIRPVTDRTLTTVDGFLAAVEACRRDGYALDDCENQPDGRCVAIPLPGLPLPSALSVSAPAARFSREAAVRAAGELVRLARPLQRDLADLAR